MSGCTSTLGSPPSSLVILIVAGAVIVITSGESVAVRFLTSIVTLDIAIRLYTRASGHDHTH